MNRNDADPAFGWNHRGSRLHGILAVSSDREPCGQMRQATGRHSLQDGFEYHRDSTALDRWR